MSSRAAREFLIALWILVAVSPSAAGAVVAIAAPGFERPSSPPRLEPATPGAQLWASIYDAPGGSGDSANAVAVAPDSSIAFVTGWSSTGDENDPNYATVAYDTRTGAERWVAFYDAPEPQPSGDEPRAIAVAPDGSRVFVTGSSADQDGLGDFATVAYDASTGAEQWVSRYTGGGGSDDGATSIAVSPDGTRVLVAGQGTAGDYITVAYDASSGAELWASRFDGGGEGAFAVTVGADGSAVYVTGGSVEYILQGFSTIAYNASTGAQLWVQRGGPGVLYDVGVSPDGSQVFVTGYVEQSGHRNDYVTIAYRSSSGIQQWRRQYDGPDHNFDEAAALDVAPDGSALYVTGRSKSLLTYSDYATMAYSAKTGARLWVSLYDAHPAGSTAGRISR